MRLPCPVGHNGLLSISGVSARPPSLLTPPLCTDVHPATSLPHCYRDRTPRALRDLRAPSGGQVCLLGFLRHEVSGSFGSGLFNYIKKPRAAKDARAAYVFTSVAF